MDAVTVIWAIGAGLCLAVAFIQGWFGWQKRHTAGPHAHLWLTGAALACVIQTLLEIRALHAPSTDALGWALRQRVLALTVGAICLVWLLDRYLGTARRWLTWAATELWVCALVFTYGAAGGPGLRTLTDLQPHPLPWGDTVVLPVGVSNPWGLLVDLATLLTLGLAVDAAARAWRGDERLRAWVLGIGLALAVGLTLAAGPLRNGGPPAPAYAACVVILAAALTRTPWEDREVPVAASPTASTATPDPYLEPALELLNTGLLVVDTDRRVTWIDEGVARLGLTPVSPGQSYETLWADESLSIDPADPLDATLADNQAHEGHAGDAATERRLRIRTRPLPNAEGQTGRVLVCVTDVTEPEASRRRLEAALADLSQRRETLEAETEGLRQAVNRLKRSAVKATDAASESLPALNTVQRDHILRVLRRTQGQIEGQGGAAQILALKPSTLRNRMHKLGITREDVRLNLETIE